MPRFTQPRRLRPKVIDDLEAMKLIEDIQTLELINELLCKLDKRTLSDDDNESAMTLRRMSFIVLACRNKARDTLRHFWLAGEYVKPRVKPQTLADIWEIFREKLNERRTSVVQRAWNTKIF